MSTQNVTLVDPYVIRTLETIRGRNVVVETVRGSLHGVLMDVKPDHIVVKSDNGDSRFFVRIQQIVHIMPI
ncbi:hypothetical protein BET03_03450 [Thermohalobacter berrensis]|uniref:DUF2642 domain-containing protein n=2 Tax=Thermohalobacter berrensis TaxID=99594 RepID=A0A419T1I9_9FIRM|nr:hypothetical protein BET03_03450 [Thermohalobacter berrensis]